MTNEDDVYRMGYQRVSRDKTVAVPLTYGDLEKIIAHFKNNKSAFAKFQEFGRLFVVERSEAASHDEFLEPLRDAINHVLSVDCKEAIFPPKPCFSHTDNVIEELLRREGYDVDWGPK